MKLFSVVIITQTPTKLFRRICRTGAMIAHTRKGFTLVFAELRKGDKIDFIFEVLNVRYPKTMVC